ncbi:MAG: hypothetical protein JJE52_03845 [Acidimicrobiia bacterium]|nr:hypothetical protein [Acidimicrobiia bacterium]
MAKGNRSAAKVKSGPIIYLAFAAVIFVLMSLFYAMTTGSDACGAANDDKEWRIFPPGWDCPTGY